MHKAPKRGVQSPYTEGALQNPYGFNEVTIERWFCKASQEEALQRHRGFMKPLQIRSFAKALYRGIFPSLYTERVSQTSNSEGDSYTHVHISIFSDRYKGMLHKAHITMGLCKPYRGGFAHGKDFANPYIWGLHDVPGALQGPFMYIKGDLWRPSGGFVKPYEASSL